MSVKLTVQIDAELRQRAKVAAARQGRSLTDVVRSALEVYVEEATASVRHASQEEHTPQHAVAHDSIFQLAGKYSGSSENIAENADDILRADSDPVRGLSVRHDETD